MGRPDNVEPAAVVANGLERLDGHCDAAPSRDSKEASGWQVFRRLMLARLPAILGCTDEEVPFVLKATRSPRILKIGIDADLIERFPGADRDALSVWLNWWTRSRHYVRKMASGARHRHDLDGVDIAGIDVSHVQSAYGALGRPLPKELAPPPPRPPSSRPLLSLPRVAATDTGAPKRIINRNPLFVAKMTADHKRHDTQTKRIAAENLERDGICSITFTS